MLTEASPSHSALLCARVRLQALGYNVGALSPLPGVRGGFTLYCADDNRLLAHLYPNKALDIFHRIETREEAPHGS